MELIPDQYYHLYNRSNSGESIFRNSENYIYFLEKFRERFKNYLEVFAYCLMPTHFHFMIQVRTSETVILKKHIGILLASYTKAFNNAYHRNGSLFQQHTKAKHVDDDSYLLTLITYIHQNPIRANLVDHLDEWIYSSYLDLAGLRNGTLANKSIIQNLFATEEEFIRYSQRPITQIKEKYWV